MVGLCAVLLVCILAMGYLFDFLCGEGGVWVCVEVEEDPCRHQVIAKECHYAKCSLSVCVFSEEGEVGHDMVDLRVFDTVDEKGAPHHSELAPTRLLPWWIAS